MKANNEIVDCDEFMHGVLCPCMMEKFNQELKATSNQAIRQANENR